MHRAARRHTLFSPHGLRNPSLDYHSALLWEPNDIAWLYKQAVESQRSSFAVIAFAIFYAGHGQDNYKIFMPCS